MLHKDATSLQPIEVQEVRLNKLVRHIENVREGCKRLGWHYINAGEVEFGVQLIKNGHIHDASKFSWSEWEYLHDGVEDELFELAVNQHIKCNPHHPEYYGTDGIQEMPRLYLNEMVVDWCSRGMEFGTDTREWVEEKATKKYGFTMPSKVGREIKSVLNIMLERPFS